MTVPKGNKGKGESTMNKYAVLAPDRKILVRRIAALTGLVAIYTRVPRCAYVIGPFAIEKDGVMNVDEGADAHVLRTLIHEGLIEGDEAQFENEEASEMKNNTEKLEASITEEATEEPATQAEPEETTEDTPTITEESSHIDDDRLIQPTVSFPLAQHTPESLRNLVLMLYSKGWLLSKATGGRFAAFPDLVQELKETLNPTIDTIRAAVQVEGAVEGLVIEEDHITFTGFPPTDDPEKINAWTQFAAAINKAAITQKRVQAQVNETDNEKFAMHVWLTRLGMNGQDQKKTRSILYQNLIGHSAFRAPEDEARWKARQQEKRQQKDTETATQNTETAG